MGWTILYIAFGLVAVWLLAEVLLQNKARLRWRLLAFVGFLGVVVGVILPQVIVIGAGLIAFAIGQTNVTLSFRRGFTTGWALRTKPEQQSRRRRARAGGAPAAEPTLQVSGLEEVPATDDTGRDEDENVFAGANAFQGGQDAYAGQDAYTGQNGYPGQDAYGAQNSSDAQGPYAGPGPYAGQSPYEAQSPYGTQGPYESQSPYPAEPAYAADSTYAGQSSYDTAAPVYAPQPMPDETGTYGIYSSDARAVQQPGYTPYDAYGNATGNTGSDGDGAVDGSGNGYAYDGGYGQPATGQAPYTDAYADPYAAYGDGLGQGGQAPYSDPYVGAQQYAAPYDPYEQPDPYGQSPYAAGQNGQYDGLGQEAGQGYSQTPPGGVWVPQQRDSDLPPEQQYPPYQQQGYDEQQYRY
ncbi:hypothetical protein [Streptomyces chattanoogensis]|uniref:Uncharacterized protein n=1 Tax=Streptomyces chattanoogensis TaxID=66876 RepID=A0A0N1JXC4_9ACTN|nr:hypothetical protein [Streptomyces chattanoogensis]KPC61735.1 hypothetical protein ADL29_23050 [Streptomyces chattanoogensis]